MSKQLTAARARELIDYDPETGEFRWKATRGRAKEGELAARRTADGRALLRLDGALFQAAHIAWLMSYESLPAGELHYRNGLRYDCRIDNLIEPSSYSSELTDEIARELLAYDQETGEFRWRLGRGHIKAGDIAGHLQEYKGGKFYRVIRILDSLHLAHRIGWLIATGKFPEGDLDHKDGDSLNNRFLNLRDSTHSQNMQNTVRRSDNKSGFKGVSWDAANSKWVARIRIPGGKYKNLGRFLDPEDAHRAYCSAANELFGEFARYA